MQGLNSYTKRLQRTVIEKINAIKSSSKLLVSLQQEVTQAAIYLLNRTPRQQTKQKTPFKIFYSTPSKYAKPDLTNLQAYRCKVYAIIAIALQKEERLKCFNLKAQISYLVSYASSNIYCVQNLVQDCIVYTRDIIFDKHQRFSSRLKELRDNIKEIDRDELVRLLSEYSLLEQLEQPEQAALVPAAKGVRDNVLLLQLQNPVQNRQLAPLSGVQEVPPTSIASLESKSSALEPVGSLEPSERLIGSARCLDQLVYSKLRFELLSTPLLSLLAILLAAVIVGSTYLIYNS